MTTEQIQATPLFQSVQLMREHLIKTDSNGYMLFLDELHACDTVFDLMELLANTLDARFQYDVVDLHPSPTFDMPEELEDRQQSIETLNRVFCWLDPEMFARQFPLSLRYALYNIHPEAAPPLNPTLPMNNETQPMLFEIGNAYGKVIFRPLNETAKTALPPKRVCLDSIEFANLVDSGKPVQLKLKRYSSDSKNNYSISPR